MVGEFEALLSSAILPVLLPVELGAKATLNAVFWPGDRVNGSVNPLMLKPKPVRLACEMVALPVPVLLMLTGCKLLVVPTVTLPKFTDVGLVASWPTATTPFPVSETAVGEFEASLTSDTKPVAVPDVVGAKLAVKDAFWPGDKVSGSVSPLTLYAAFVTLSCEMVTLPVPVLLMLTGCGLLVVPTVTLLKFRLVG